MTMNNTAIKSITNQSTNQFTTNTQSINGDAMNTTSEMKLKEMNACEKNTVMSEQNLGFFNLFKRWRKKGKNPDFMELLKSIIDQAGLSESDKTTMLKAFNELNDRQLNVMFVGGTGVGKSSTINALFDTNKARVGVGVDPETMTIDKYELDQLTIWDSPGLGDGVEADRRHSKNITDKLTETDEHGHQLIDLVVVILDGGSREMGTSYQLINEVIIPCLKNEAGRTDRLLIACNQADMAMKGQNWDFKKNEPKAPLVEFLDGKMASIKKRIKEATGVETHPMYYSAGYTDGDDAQIPWNVAKLLYLIVSNAPKEKCYVLNKSINQNEGMWTKHDGKDRYTVKTKKSLFNNFLEQASEAVDSVADTIGDAARSVARGISNAVSSVASAVGSFFSSWW